MNTDHLYSLQDSALKRLQAMGSSSFDEAKLCGGTALSRCWLSHRISYDLDFFFPEGFDARKMAESLKRAGILYETKDIVDDRRKANQLHGYVVHEGERLKVSFVEDAYFELFPSIQKPFGSFEVKTEEVAGLYHRKLRTVSGSGMEGASFEGGRQKARDLFDLYVLSSSYLPIRPFMASLPYAFPSDAFDNGLVSMPWFELIDELEEIVCDPKWSEAKNIDFLQQALLAQIGAETVIDECAADDDEIARQSLKRRSGP